MKHLQFTFVLGIFLTCSTTSMAQSPIFSWVKTFGAYNIDRPEAITTDNNGNIYVTGRFQGTVDFDPGPGTFNITSKGEMDIFVQKLNSLGDLVWVKTMGGTNREYGTSIALDSLNNIYLTGKFMGTADFDPGTGTNYQTSNGDRDIFLLKLNPQGNLIWVKTYGGTGYDTGHSLAIGNSSNIYLTGKFVGSVDFDPGMNTHILPSFGAADIFIQKLDSAGNHIWAYSFGSSGWEIGKSVTVDKWENVIFTGTFNYTIDFHPGTQIANHTSNGNTDYFVLKLDSSGNYIWSNSFGGYSQDASKSITTDTSGNIYLTGQFQNTVDFDPNTSTYNLSSNGQNDIFVQKLDTAGNLLWAHSFGAGNTDIGRELHISDNNEVLVTGYFNNSVDFDPSTAVSQESSNGNSDIFILNLNSNGNFNWCKTMGGQYDDYGWSITSHSGSSIYTAGTFKSTVDFDPGTSVHNETSNGNFDAFVHKLGKQASITSITDTACYSYTVPSGDETYFTSGNYYDTIHMASGGDSIIDINITIIDIDTTVINSANILTAVECGNLVTYQWVHCEDMQPIAGEINQTFIPTYNDGYAVIITKWNCVDTSSCHLITTLGIEQKANNDLISIQPNPAKNYITINSKQSLKNVQLKITNMQGQIIKRDNYNLIKGNNYIINTSDFPTGVYLMIFKNKQFSFSKKLFIYN